MSTAFDKITIASANAIIPKPFKSPIPSKSETFKNIANSAHKVPTLIKPFIKVLTSRFPNFITASPSILIASANITRPAAVRIIFPDESLINLLEATNTVAIPATETNPLAISFQFKSDILFIAFDNINIAVDNSIIDIATLVIPLNLLPLDILSNINIEPINSPIKVAIAAKEAVNLPDSIIDNNNNEPANIAIAVAIFIKVLDFISV